ncbi:MAG: type II secretion system F family protein [Nanoarchaeota archaeon]
MNIANYLLSKQPLLKKKLRIAKIDVNPKEYVKSAFKKSLVIGGSIAVLTFFMKGNEEPFKGLLLGIILGLIVAKIMYSFTLKKVDVAISKKAKEIDRQVLFAGRFLLIKLNSGKPLITALEEASHGFGAATEYFKEIMRRIELGTPMEQALDEATEYCPSKHLKKILFQITNALKIGVDVTNFLSAIIDEISEEQMQQIVRYGKKLSSLTMFYMLAAIVVPSLGMTLLIVVASLISININMIGFSIITVFLFFLQFIFISLFRSARPNLDI